MKKMGLRSNWNQRKISWNFIDGAPDGYAMVRLRFLSSIMSICMLFHRRLRHGAPCLTLASLVSKCSVCPFPNSCAIMRSAASPHCMQSTDMFVHQSTTGHTNGVVAL